MMHGQKNIEIYSFTVQLTKLIHE